MRLDAHGGQAGEPARMEQAVEALRRGAIVGVPTDTVYGLAVDPLRSEAVQALYVLKGRPRDKPIGLLGAEIDDFSSLVEITPAVRDLAECHWPGGLTLVVGSRVPLPAWVGDHARHTVAIRVPDHPSARRLFASTGPLAVTSANPTGGKEAVNREEAEGLFGTAVAVYLPGSCPGGIASTVIDVTVDPPAVVREGPVEWRVQHGKWKDGTIDS